MKQDVVALFYEVFEYSPLSNCRGGVNYQIFNFFPLTPIYYHPPICEDFEKVRPPLIIANPHKVRTFTYIDIKKLNQ